jgi:hypothetical protein
VGDVAVEPCESGAGFFSAGMRGDFGEAPVGPEAFVCSAVPWRLFGALAFCFLAVEALAASLVPVEALSALVLAVEVVFGAASGAVTVGI